MIPSTIALEEYLKPLALLLNDTYVSEILVNRPECVFIERQGFFEKQTNNALTHRHLMGLSNLIARFTEQRLSDKEPLLSAKLPSGHRIQIILPPATTQGNVVMCIRKQTIAEMSLDDLAALQMFKNTKPYFLSNAVSLDKHNEDDDTLLQHYINNNYITFLKSAIQFKKNILIAGATSTGKTTFLNACLNEIPMHEHLVTLEDVPEVKPPHPLHTPLFTSKGLQGVCQITMQDLIQASLRIRPDRIILGELRGSEASDFINATATGHDGSLTSVHAATPAMAFMRLVHMVKLSGSSLSRDDILHDLHSVIDIVVQLKRRMMGDRYYREVSHIYYNKAKRDEMS